MPPAGEPVVLLDGWNDGGIGHCVFNGLNWGPDGWLYGNQGIQGESRVGKPGTPANERVRFNGGIWRYHPTDTSSRWSARARPIPGAWISTITAKPSSRTVSSVISGT